MMSSDPLGPLSEFNQTFFVASQGPLCLRRLGFGIGGECRELGSSRPRTWPRVSWDSCRQLVAGVLYLQHDSDRHGVHIIACETTEYIQQPQNVYRLSIVQILRRAGFQSILSTNYNKFCAEQDSNIAAAMAATPTISGECARQGLASPRLPRHVENKAGCSFS